MRADLPLPGVSISSARQADRVARRSTSGSPLTRLCQRPKRDAAAAAGRRRSCWTPRRRALREHHAARAVEVPGRTLTTSTSQDGERAELLRAGADAAVHRGGRRGGQLARHAPDLVGVDAAHRRDRLGREGLRRAPAPRRARRSGSASGAEVDQALVEQHVRRSRSASARRCPGRMKWCSSDSSAVRDRRGSMTTTLPPRARIARSRPAHVGRGHQAAVGRQRVGAEDHQVVGAVDVGDGHAEARRRTSGRTRTASASGRRCEAE